MMLIKAIYLKKNTEYSQNKFSEISLQFKTNIFYFNIH